MICDECRETVHTIYNSSPGKWTCRNCSSVSIEPQLFHVKNTVYYKWYPKNGGNVSAARVNMVKSRAICPDDNRSVVMRNHAGKITDRKAVNY